ncbi:MAG: succinylglutamate desuccinylase/aspartoacylase family protein, partial [Pseudomonadota bacterium]
MIRSMRVTLFLLLPLLINVPYAAAQDLAEQFCDRVDRKLSSVGRLECMGVGLQPSGRHSVNNTPIFYKDYLPEGEPAGKVLLIGGIHGDEYSSVSVVFKWLTILRSGAGKDYHWRVVPVLNPDGLLRPHGKSI